MLVVFTNVKAAFGDEEGALGDRVGSKTPFYGGHIECVEVLALIELE